MQMLAVRFIYASYNNHASGKTHALSALTLQNINAAPPPPPPADEDYDYDQDQISRNSTTDY